MNRRRLLLLLLTGAIVCITCAPSSDTKKKQEEHVSPKVMLKAPGNETKEKSDSSQESMNNKSVKPSRLCVPNRNHSKNELVIDDDWLEKNKEDVVFENFYKGTVTLACISQHSVLPINIVFRNGIQFLNISENPNLKSIRNIKISGLIEELHVSWNPQLSELPDLSRVKKIDSVGIWDNEKIETLNELSSVKTISRLAIVRNAMLKNLYGLRNSRILEQIRVSENSSLVSIDGLKGAAEKLQILSIRMNANLSDIGPLRNVKYADIVHLEGPKLIIPDWAKVLAEKGRCGGAKPC